MYVATKLVPFSQSNVRLFAPAAARRSPSDDDRFDVPAVAASALAALDPPLAALAPPTVPAVPYVLFVVPAPVLGVLPGGSIVGAELPVEPELLPVPLPLVRPELLPLVMLGVVLPAVPMSELPLPDAPPMSLPVLPPLVSPAGRDEAEPDELAVRDAVGDEDVSVPVLAQAPSSSDVAATVVIASALMRMS